MIIEGNFKYFFDNEEKTREEIEKLANYATNITVGDGVVNYFSPKKEKIDIECRLKLAEYYKEKAFKDYNLENPLTKIGDYLDKNGSHSIGIEEITNILKKTDIEKLLEYVDAYQEQNGGRVIGVEFPFDAILTPQKSWLQYAYDNATEPVGDTEYSNKLYAEYEQKHTKSADKRYDKAGTVTKVPNNPLSNKTFRTFLVQDDYKKCSGKCFCDGSCKEREEREKEIIEDWNKIDLIDSSNLPPYKDAPMEEFLDAWCKALTCSGESETFKFGAKKEIGQKHNKLKAPLDILQTRQFPKALQLLALATSYGNSKYKETDKDFLNFKRVEGGYQTYLDASSRHSADRLGTDKESRLPHFIHAVWNQLAALEIWAEENEINIEEFSKDYLKHLVVSK